MYTAALNSILLIATYSNDLLSKLCESGDCGCNNNRMLLKQSTTGQSVRDYSPPPRSIGSLTPHNNHLHSDCIFDPDCTSKQKT